MGDVVGVPEEVRAALAGGATVLTGRQRAARGLQQAVDRANRAAGMGSWAPARIFAWDAWTRGLWRRLLLDGVVDRMLLNRTQERALWMEAIEGDAGLSTLRSVGSLAGLAAEAWGDLARHGGLGRLRGSATNGDTEAFVRWAGTFEERCRAGGYMAQARLEGALRRAWRERPESLPEEREILLVGFDRVLPAQGKVLEDLRGAGCVVREIGEGVAGRGRLVVAADEGEERVAAAEWVRGVLRERPEARVGVLVPGLKESAVEQAGLDRVFRGVLRLGAYEFSTGVGLDRTGMGRLALALLGWTEEAMGVEGLGEMLLSPYFAGGGERSARAEFDGYELRRRTMLRPEMGLDEFVGVVEGSMRRGRLGEMLVCLRRMQGVVRRFFGVGEQGSYADWAEGVREMLRAAGWAEGGGSLEFQVRERWEGALDEMATLDFEGGRVEFGRALEALRGIAERTTFAPESRDAPVQVMGPEEAAGLRFDAVWMMGAGDLRWPGAVAGSPLLAWPLRRELGMPGSDVGADAAQARRVTERIAASGGEVVFSYALETAEGKQRVAAVVAGLGLEEVAAELEQGEGEVVELEVVEDGGRLPGLPEGRAVGGVGVLKAQAACAFHAFAEHRLFATELEAREVGMNARESGMAVHGMLEGFWAEVKTQAVLKGMTAVERDEVLLRAINEALTKAGRVRTEWDGAYLETQRKRLLGLGRQWLELEAGRAVPFRVERRESEEKNLRIGPLTLTVRLDRVDATDAGSVLIDYKTGKASPSAWGSARPDEPQLPLYAVLAGGAGLGAVGFGVVRTGEMKLTGYEAGSGLLTRAGAMETGSLEEEVERWRGVLEGLAVSFAEGDARVSPKVYPGTCQYCAHRLLCRLDVTSWQAEEGDEESAEGERG